MCLSFAHVLSTVLSFGMHFAYIQYCCFHHFFLIWPVLCLDLSRSLWTLVIWYENRKMVVEINFLVKMCFLSSLLVARNYFSPQNSGFSFTLVDRKEEKCNLEANIKHLKKEICPVSISEPHSCRL